MAAADYRLMTEATGVRIAEALEDVTAMVGPKGDPGDVSEAELTAKLADKADVILDTASGAIASFPDGAAVPAKDITIGIEPVQSGSGDPSSTNVRPISGWTGANVTRCGKNLLNNTVSSTTNQGITWTVNSDKTVSATGTASADSFLFIFFDDLPPGNYYFSGCPNGGSFSKYDVFMWDYTAGSRAKRWNGTGNSDSDINGFLTEFKVEANHVYRFSCRIHKDATVNNIIFTPMVCVHTSLDATYEPYSGTTYPISWQSVAGTVYGGTLDVTTGLLTVTHGYIASYNGESLPGRWISSMDVYSAGGTPTTGAQVVYEFVTPQTYQLSPTDVALLMGDNNVWADTGDSTVTYRADTKLYIQKINAPTDDDMIADAQIASGKYFIIGGNLYRSTTTIPAGDTITPGTNCILTNLADALNALNT